MYNYKNGNKVQALYVGKISIKMEFPKFSKKRKFILNLGNHSEGEARAGCLGGRSPTKDGHIFHDVKMC